VGNGCSSSRAVLGINPFDQPDVQTAKDAAKQTLEAYKSSHDLPEIGSRDDLAQWLVEASPDSYLAIMAYINQKPAIDSAIRDLRKIIMERYGIATTFGYGPRYLHSTGQLHKGGPDKGIFLQIVVDRMRDLQVPGQPYSFNLLTEAEAQGDYRALELLGRKIQRVHLCSSTGKEIRKLIPTLSR